MRFERRINYYETDQMGIVHHSNYVRYLEEARIFLLDSCGLSYRNMEQTGIIIPVLSVNLDYKQPLTFGDDIVIETRITRFSGVKMTVCYTAYRKKDMQITTTGETKHCFLDAETFKPVNIKKTRPELYDGFVRICDETEK